MSVRNQVSPPNWYQQLESNRRFVISAVVFLSLVLMAAMSWRNPTDFDGYWHLQMGKDWIENGLSPYKDHYSFTYANETIVTPPVFFQVGLYALVNMFGEWAGFIIVKLLAFALTLGCMLAWMKQIKASTLAYCLVFPMLTIIILLRAQIRPELFSYSLSILALILYHRANLSLSIKAIAPVALLLLFWVNYHSSIFGYVIFFALFVDIGLKLIKEKAGRDEWIRWASWGFLLVAIGFMNPSVRHPAYAALTFPSEWKVLIQEYQPPFAVLKSIPSIYLMVIIAITTLFLALRQGRVGYVVCGGVFLYGSLSMIRLVTPTAIIFLAIFAHVISDTKIKTFFLNHENRQLRLALSFTLATLVIPTWQSTSLVRSSIFSNTHYTTLFPEHLVAYMQDNNKSGRIYNSYELGGFLLHRLSPESQVYIDGRTDILYPVKHLLKWREAQHVSATLAKEIQRYDIDFAVIKSTAYDARMMLQAKELKLDYVDYKYALYSRESASLPYTGRLWAEPYCWTDKQSDVLAAERQSAMPNLPEYLPVMKLLSFATRFAASKNRKHWLNELDLKTIENDESRRFIGYQALDYGLNDTAITLFGSISLSERKDFLAFALAYLRNNQIDDAEETLAKATKLATHKLVLSDILIMAGLINEIQQHRSLKHIDQKVVDSITEEAEKLETSKEIKPVSLRTFCSKQHWPNDLETLTPN